jgi:hypothetical protein
LRFAQNTETTCTVVSGTTTDVNVVRLGRDMGMTKGPLPISWTLNSEGTPGGKKKKSKKKSAPIFMLPFGLDRSVEGKMAYVPKETRTR